ncbi:MAG: hypothetical protein AB1486_10055 [Planctomycetota bacterium]
MGAPCSLGLSTAHSYTADGGPARLSAQEDFVKAQLVQMSCVVLGMSHNPTILNPDFLMIRRIVPKEWGWEVSETVTTPVFAVVRYTAGLAISVEPNRLQVVDVACGSQPTKTRAPEIAGAYVQCLPHVRYSAVGVNFQSVVCVAGTPEEMLRDRFIAKGPFDRSSRQPDGAGVRFLYGLGHDGRLTLSLDGGQQAVSESPNEKQPVVLINGNFHRACRTYPADTEVCEHLSHVRDDWEMYKDLEISVLALEG